MERKGQISIEMILIVVVVLVIATAFLTQMHVRAGEMSAALDNQSNATIALMLNKTF
jgi:uncharacterized protein (UPF0333 family)